MIDQNVEKHISKRIFYVNLILSFISLALFVMIAIFVVTKGDLAVDSLFFDSVVAPIRNHALTEFFRVFTYLGSSFFLMIVIIILLLCCKDKKIGTYAGVNLIVIIVMNFLLKNIVERVRPDSISLIAESGYSFPSGHAMMTMAVVSVFIYFSIKKIRSYPLKSIIISILVLLILAIGFSRIYLGVHYFTDVLAGFLIGYALSMFDIYLLEEITNGLRRYRPNR